MTAHDNAIIEKIRGRILGVEGGRVREIILHGSRAKGCAKSASDFDVLVIVEDPLGDWIERSMELRRLFYDLDPEVDVQVFGATEFEECRHVPGTLAYPADNSGIRIYEKTRRDPRADRSGIRATRAG